MKPALTAALLLLLASPGPGLAQEVLAPKDCFNVRNINSRFARTGTNTVNMSVAGKDIYELTWAGPCGGVDWLSQQATLFNRSGGSIICKATDVDIIVGAPLGRRQCRLTAIRKLTPEQVAALPPKARP